MPAKIGELNKGEMGEMCWVMGNGSGWDKLIRKGE